PSGWRIGSYSGLVLGASHEASGSDHDERIADISQPEEAETPLPPDDILLFPAQRYAGNCLHTVFEQADFTDENTWDKAIENALTRHPPYGRSNPENGKPLKALGPMVQRMLRDVLHTRLQDGVRLADIGKNQRLTELEFFLPVTHLPAASLYELLSPHYAIPQLAFQPLEGYLKGFIDLMFTHAGRFYILDWKSNLLGRRQADYGQVGISNAMSEHSYHLQHLLYTVALNRYLAQRIPDYDYKRHFGGVFYLFIRGVRPEWQMENGNPSGVFFHRADEGLIRQLDALIHTGGNR
ncbi:MAG: PD-(D/E)XK nuclease family protein, partial [Burkholderiaceae bacterium]|nr:PD-(D/E)XK nuclease family protein [Burkholderiaceae bacterium]